MNFSSTGYSVVEISEVYWIVTHSTIKNTPWSLAVFVLGSSLRETHIQSIILPSIIVPICAIVLVVAGVAIIFMMRYRAKVSKPSI